MRGGSGFSALAAPRGHGFDFAKLKFFPKFEAEGRSIESAFGQFRSLRRWKRNDTLKADSAHRPDDRQFLGKDVL